MHAPLLGLMALIDFLSRSVDRRGRFRTFDLRWQDGAREPSFVFAEASSLRHAIHHLGAEVLETLRECDLDLDDVPPDLPPEYATLTAEARAFVLRAWGEVSGPYYHVRRPTTDPYVGELALAQLEGARFTFAFGAAPPNQDSAFGVLELQPVAFDDRLHRAVANADLARVRALLDDGADPNVGAAFGNAPIFATRDGDRLRPLGEKLRDGAPLEIACALADAGMDRDVSNPAGETVLDLAMAGDELAFEWALRAGFHERRYEGRGLPHLLARLPYGDDAALEVRRRELLVELRRGADPNRRQPLLGAGDQRTALGWFFNLTYHPHEVAEPILTAFVRTLLDHGARDRPDEHGQTAASAARRAVERGQTNYRGVVELLGEHPVDR